MAGRDRLKFLVRAAGITQASLGGMRPGDRLNLAHDLFDYIGRIPTPELRAAERGDALALWPALEAVGRLVSAVAHRKAGKMEPVSITGLRLDARELRRASDETGRDAPTWAFMVEGLRDTAVCQAWHDLTSSNETSRIDVCALQSCGRIFYADRTDQRYCTHACATKKAVKVFRGKPPASAALA